MLRSILNDHTPGGTATRTELEAALLAICRMAGLTRPEVNAWIPLEPTGYEADLLRRAEGLIAEADGRSVHAIRSAFERDRRREQRLMLAGYPVVRFSRRQIVEDPRSVADTLRGLLTQAG